LQGDKYKGFTLTQRVISSVVSDFNAPADKGYEDNGRSKRRKTTPTEVTAPAKVVYNVPDVNDMALAVDLQAEEYDKKPQEAIAETGLLRGEELLTGMDVASSFPFWDGSEDSVVETDFGVDESCTEDEDAEYKDSSRDSDGSSEEGHTSGEDEDMNETD
jgi:hypothetical protein